MTPRRCALVCILVFLCGPLNAFARQPPAGIIKSVSGEVFVTDGETKVKAVANMRISQGDSILTSGDSSAGLIFEDDTVVALGPNSEIFIDAFLFDPANKKLSLVTKMIHGTFSYISGQIAKLAPKKVVIETPDATLGVRGTKFLVKVD